MKSHIANITLKRPNGEPYLPGVGGASSLTRFLDRAPRDVVFTSGELAEAVGGGVTTHQVNGRLGKHPAYARYCYKSGQSWIYGHPDAIAAARRIDAGEDEPTDRRSNAKNRR